MTHINTLENEVANDGKINFLKKISKIISKENFINVSSFCDI